MDTLILLSTFLLAPLLIFVLATKLCSHGKAPTAAAASFKSGLKLTELPLPPGPRGIPVFGNLFQLGTKPHHTLHAFSRTYGPLLHLRLGSTNVVVASNAATASACLKTHDANFSSRPVNAGATYIAYDRQDLVWAPYGPRWRMLRKICTLHLFSPKAIEDFSGIRQQEVSRLVAKLASTSKGSPPFQVGNWLTMCAANVLTRAMLGRRLFVASDAGDGRKGGSGAAEVDDELRMANEFKNMAIELMQLAGEFVIGDFLPKLAWIDPKRVVSKMKALNKRFDCFFNAILKEHMNRPAGGDEHRDMLAVLLGLKDSKEGGDQEARLNDTEIKALLLDLFTAGTDTTSSTLEWALAELIRQPDLLHQAQKELDAVVGRDRLVSESDLADLPFLNAIVKETFRLHPSTPLSLPHLASDDCEVGGYRVPAGATLLVNVWAISRDPAAWPDPLKFRPARFLPGGEAESVDVRGNHFEVIPFGAGRRICAGMNWGLRMVHLMAATLIHAFHWELPADQDPNKLNMEEAYGLTLQRAVPLLVRPTPRLEAAAYDTAAY